jgi:adenylate kinase
MIIMLGTPGAGKTTQTKMLAEYLNCPWFSMGELIRQYSSGQDRKDMLSGKIISDESTLKIVDKALADINTASEECIFEGNPRSITQAKWWIEQQKTGRFKIKGIIHLVIEPSIAEERLQKRGRLDDYDSGVIEKRFAEYQRSIDPTLTYLEDHGMKVFEIQAAGTIEEVAKRIHAALEV